MANTRTTTFSPTPPAIIAPTLILSPTSLIDIPTPALGVDQLMDVVSTLLVEEPTLPPVSTKRARDKGQQSSRIVGSPK